MQIEMIRCRGYRGVSLESGRVVEVDNAFGAEAIRKGWARAYTPPAPAPAVVEAAPLPAPTQQAKRGRKAG
jgi:hypothetical protein